MKKIEAQVVLTPAESKKLIAKGVLQLGQVQKALQEGILALHPSGSTLFILEEIVGKVPKSLWVCGVVTPRGLCLSSEALGKRASKQASENNRKHAPESFMHTWVIQNGKLQDKMELKLLLDKMGSNDVYVKGANALDPDKNAGVLFANPSGKGGTIGKVRKASQKKNFSIIIPIGLEKLIPVSIGKAAKKAGFKRTDKAMGLPCGLIPVSGKVITEIDAIRILTGVTATPIAAGGYRRAEGAVVLSVEGSMKEINILFEIIKQIKGVELPKLNLPDCTECHFPTCHFRKIGPFWGQ